MIERTLPMELRSLQLMPVLLLLAGIVYYLNVSVVYGVDEHSSEPGSWLDGKRLNLEKLAEQVGSAALSLDVIDQYFASQQIGRHVLGPAMWQGLSADQRLLFLQRFGSLLHRALGARIDEFRSMQFEKTQERRKNKFAQVNYICRNQAREVNLVYTLYRVEDSWRIYDINIDGVSMLRGYMAQIRPIAREKGFTGVIKALDEKLAALHQ